MNALFFLINTVFDLYLLVVLLRLWLQFARADFYNPFSQSIVKVTQPILAPMRRFIPSIGRFDTATFVLAFVVALGKIYLLQAVAGNYVVPFTMASFIAFGTVIKQIFQMIFWVLIIRAILSWVSQGRSPIEYVMHQLTEPFLGPIRRVLPSLGGLDLSVLVAILVLQFLQILVTDLFGQIMM
ncbi:YggT family protein [Vibrio sp. SS-MA-C1-2]|uniref:YggT family protein n=1 Tax=Vibrio sp. SS-MA-C1-2 TaxID=2908646 RepID=UPI001F2185A7|nr:YggT family protein [Vibrio sp. SS-MA-C1-2]UJF19066.1 YggT family protein [Vibrio sp. SS-MA-C1-2]